MSRHSNPPFQPDKPIFVKTPQGFLAQGRFYKKGQEVKWKESRMDENKIRRCVAQGILYHNQELEVVHKTGDRLGELDSEQLKTLVRLLNDDLKGKVNGKEEFAKKKCKQSRVDDRQRALIRNFVYNHKWAQDRFYEHRDYILGE